MFESLRICATLADKQINVVIVCQRHPAATAGAAYIILEKNSHADKQNIQIQILLVDMN